MIDDEFYQEAQAQLEELTGRKFEKLNESELEAYTLVYNDLAGKLSRKKNLEKLTTVTKISGMNEDEAAFVEDFIQATLEDLRSELPDSKETLLLVAGDEHIDLDKLEDAYSDLVSKMNLLNGLVKIKSVL